MALFGRDYDRELGSRGGTWDRGYDRAYRGGWNDSDRDGGYLRMRRYEPMMGGDRDTGRGGYDRGFGAAGYDRAFAREAYDREFGRSGYDRGYKSRWQTDHGDPFGDRTARTPMRVIRGEYRSGYDRPYQGGAQQGGYDRGFDRGNPMGYDPYAGREGTWMRGSDPGRRAYGRGYDTGWF